MENIYPIYHHKKFGKWYVMLEQWNFRLDIYLKYYTGKNFLHVDWTTFKEEKQNFDEYYITALNHKEYYLEKLVEELHDEFYEED